jgi:predicted transcriptional regulator
VGREAVAATPVPLTDSEIKLAFAILAELRQNGRVKQEELIRKTMALADARLAEILDASPWSEVDLGEDEKAALRRGLAGIEAGKFVPDDVMNPGRPAVEAYRRRRDWGVLGLHSA